MARSPAAVAAMVLAPALLLAALPAWAGEAPLPAWPVPGGRHHAVFLDRQGAHEARLVAKGPCNGPVLVHVEVDLGAGPPMVWEGPGRSWMAPDLCRLACWQCPAPFAWRLTAGDALDLAGGGQSGLVAAWSIQGPFGDGVLAHYGMNVPYVT